MVWVWVWVGMCKDHANPTRPRGSPSIASRSGRRSRASRCNGPASPRVCKAWQAGPRTNSHQLATTGGATPFLAGEQTTFPSPITDLLCSSSCNHRLPFPSQSPRPQPHLRPPGHTRRPHPRPRPRPRRLVTSLVHPSPCLRRLSDSCHWVSVAYSQVDSYYTLLYFTPHGHHLHEILRSVGSCSYSSIPRLHAYLQPRLPSPAAPSTSYPPLPKVPPSTATALA